MFARVLIANLIPTVKHIISIEALQQNNFFPSTPSPQHPTHTPEILTKIRCMGVLPCSLMNYFSSNAVVTDMIACWSRWLKHYVAMYLMTLRLLDDFVSKDSFRYHNSFLSACLLIGTCIMYWNC